MEHIRDLNAVFEKTALRVRLWGEEVAGDAFHLQPRAVEPGRVLYEGAYHGVALTVEVWREDETLLKLQASLQSDRPFQCDRLVFEGWYHQPGADFSGCYVPGGNRTCGVTGLKRLGDVPVTPEDVRFCGLFSGSDEPCLLLATVIPSNWMLTYQAALEGRDRVRFTATNHFTSGEAQRHCLKTETVCVLTGLTPTEAIRRYSRQLPLLSEAQFASPLVGWSSWDYYFTDITPENLEENMMAIREDPALSEKLRCFFVDDGWQHREGEWVANHRFPMGTRGLAEKIADYGFVPGIWTNGCQVWFLTHTGLRCGEMFLKDAHGNAITFENRLIIDPTHPMGEQFIYETHKRLREDGFRLFKVDFVSQLLLAKSFHDPDCGPYEAIRRLFQIVRRAVGEDAQIIGCSYPADCGPGLVESCRFAVDIHNHWSHVLWIMEYMQMSFWENGRLYRLDPDFLVVRGRETSKEATTNVFNPAPGLSAADDAVSSRWRKGEEFNAVEAETWANLVVFCAGNIVVGDRISMLNERGLELLRHHLKPNRAAAVPLDLGDGLHARQWYSEEDRKLLVINVEDAPSTLRVEFARFGLVPPETLRCEKPFVYENGLLEVSLARHESAVFAW